MSNTTSPDVSRGLDGATLFLVGGNQHVLSYLTGETPINPHVIGAFRADLAKRKLRCDRIGAAYAHIVTPDKHSVSPDLFPHATSVNVGRIYKDACGDLFCLPVNAFRNIGPTRGYLRTDTHWNADGGIAFVATALSALGVHRGIFENARDAIASMRYEKRVCGDLGNKLTPQEYEKATMISKPAGMHVFSNNVSDNNWRTYVAINMDAPLDRLLVLGDSYAINCLCLLWLFFKEILMIRSTNFHTELLGAFNPTHVLTENVERYLPSMRPDKLAPNALVAPFLMRKKMAPDERFYEALNAVLKQGSPQHDAFISSLRPPADC